MTCGFFFQAEDGIRDRVRSRGLGDVYKRQDCTLFDFQGREIIKQTGFFENQIEMNFSDTKSGVYLVRIITCLLYTSDAADERSSVDLGGRRIIKKKKYIDIRRGVTNAEITHNKQGETTQIIH